jgi:hypothetical protein
MGFVSVVMMANRSRSYDRMGQSEITPEIRSTTDRASRTLLRMEVAQEFFSAPQRYILGAAESAFQDASGGALSAWQTYIGRVLALESDENGVAPTVGTFPAHDPTVSTKSIDMDARIMSSLTGLPPHVLGYTTDNPASADAIRSAEMRHTSKADTKITTFDSEVSKAGRMVAAYLGKTIDFRTPLTMGWASTATPTLSATTDAVSKLIAAGYMPATSSLVGDMIGLTAEQQDKVEADRAKDPATSELAALSHSLAAKNAKADLSVGRNLGGPTTTSAPTSAAAPAPVPPSAAHQ